MSSGCAGCQSVSAIFHIFSTRSYPIPHRIILFCTEHSLSPSIKAGGYGTAGWAINGDVVVDLSYLQEIDIEPPHPGGGYTSIRDMAPLGSKGKGRAGAPVLGTPSQGSIVGMKRQREEEIEAKCMGIPTSTRAYDSASVAVASFLHGPPLPADGSGEAARGPPINRRRVDMEGNAVATLAMNAGARQL